MLKEVLDKIKEENISDLGKKSSKTVDANKPVLDKKVKENADK